MCTGCSNACSAAIRPCSIAVAASPPPATSPTAKMCGTEVRKSLVDLAAARACRPPARCSRSPARPWRPGGRPRRARSRRRSPCPRRAGSARGPPTDSIASTLLAQAERDVVAAQQVLERLADLAVEEVERAVALVDDRDLGAERAEHRGVLDADHAGADDRHRARHAPVELQQAVGVDDRAVVEGDGVRARGLRPDRDRRCARRGSARRSPRSCTVWSSSNARVARAASRPCCGGTARARPRSRRRSPARRGPSAAAAPAARSPPSASGRARRAGAPRAGRAPPRAASSTGSCPCGWRRRRGGRGAPRPRRACRASPPGWRPSGPRARSR